MLQNWFDKLGDIFCFVLIVRIGIDDNICSLAQALFDTRHKSFGKSLVVFKVDDVVYTALFGNLDSIICAAVVDDKPLYRIETFDLSWQCPKCNGKCFGLIVTGDLDDKFHKGQLLSVVLYKIKEI